MPSSKWTTQNIINIIFGDVLSYNAFGVIFLLTANIYFHLYNVVSSFVFLRSVCMCVCFSYFLYAFSCLFTCFV